MLYAGYSAEPLWTLNPGASPYDPDQEQAYVYWVPGSMEHFYLLHYHPTSGMVALKLGLGHLDVFSLDPVKGEVRLSDPAPYAGPGPDGPQLSGPDAIARAVNKVWRAIDAGTFDLHDFREFIENADVAQRIRDTQSHPYRVTPLPEGLAQYYAAFRSLPGNSNACMTCP